MGRDYPLQAKAWSEAGFTLLEALITLSIFAVVLVAILQIYDSNQQTYVRGEAKVDLQQNIRVALGQITADIHLAGFDPNNAIQAQTVKYPLQPIPGTAVSDALSTSELRLIGDVDGDGSSDCVSYYRDAVNKQLMQRKTAWTSGACTWTGTGSVVADNITGLTFTYWTATGASTTSANPTDVPNQAKRVRVVITGTSITYGMTFTGDSEAAIRQ